MLLRQNHVATGQHVTTQKHKLKHMSWFNTNQSSKKHKLSWPHVKAEQQLGHFKDGLLLGFNLSHSRQTSKHIMGHISAKHMLPHHKFASQNCTRRSSTMRIKQLNTCHSLTQHATAQHYIYLSHAISQ